MTLILKDGIFLQHSYVYTDAIFMTSIVNENKQK